MFLFLLKCSVFFICSVILHFVVKHFVILSVRGAIQINVTYLLILGIQPYNGYSALYWVFSLILVSQMAERLGNRAINQKVSGAIPRRAR